MFAQTVRPVPSPCAPIVSQRGSTRRVLGFDSEDRRRFRQRDWVKGAMALQDTDRHSLLDHPALLPATASPAEGARHGGNTTETLAIAGNRFDAAHDRPPWRQSRLPQVSIGAALKPHWPSPSHTDCARTRKASCTCFRAKGVRTMTHVRPEASGPDDGRAWLPIGVPHDQPSRLHVHLSKLRHNTTPCDFQWVFQWNVEEPNVVGVSWPLPVAQQTDWAW